MRLFPGQKRDVLEVVLRGCGGDFAQAIECILASNDETKEQTLYRAPTFHPIPSPFSFIGRGIPPFLAPPFPSNPLRPLCTTPNCKCYRSSYNTPPFKNTKTNFSSLNLSFGHDTRNGAPYFRFPPSAFLSLAEKHENTNENGHARNFAAYDTRERCEETSPRSLTGSIIN